MKLNNKQNILTLSAKLWVHLASVPSVPQNKLDFARGDTDAKALFQIMPSREGFIWNSAFSYIHTSVLWFESLATTMGKTVGMY